MLEKIKKMTAEKKNQKVRKFNEQKEQLENKENINSQKMTEKKNSYKKEKLKQNDQNKNKPLSPDMLYNIKVEIDKKLIVMKINMIIFLIMNAIEMVKNLMMKRAILSKELFNINKSLKYVFFFGFFRLDYFILIRFSYIIIKYRT